LFNGGNWKGQINLDYDYFKLGFVLFPVTTEILFLLFIKTLEMLIPPLSLQNVCEQNRAV